MAWKASMSVLRKILISRPRQPRDKSDASPVHLDFAKRFNLVQDCLHRMAEIAYGGSA